MQTHNNPDPDAIATAYALVYLFERYTGRSGRIAFGGVVGRSENRAMLRQLNIQVIPSERTDYRSCDLIALVDSQPGFRYNPMPEDIVPQIVIDHHPQREDSIPDGVEVAILLEEYGATASIMADLIAANRIPVTEKVATALAYGIKADTQDLGRETSEGDIRAYTYIYALANKRIISRIESARVPRNYFQEFAKAIENAVIYDIAVISDLGDIEVADMAAEMADFLLRLEGIRWSFVMGRRGEALHLSLRASDHSLNSGEAIAAAVGSHGSCGGHAAMAGGQIPIAGKSDEEVLAIREDVFSSFLRAIKIKRSLRKPLVGEEEDDVNEKNTARNSTSS